VCLAIEKYAKYAVFGLVIAILPGWSKQQSTLKVDIRNIRSFKGKLWFAVFRPNEHFGEGRPNIYKIVEVGSHSSQVVDFDLDPGRYALAVYQDLNGNDVLDKNFIGIPKEPYGFSNNFRPRFSAPKFEDCAFELPIIGKTVVVKLTD
jgi:uncharacterized protein (DUF2141 family)